MFPSPDTNGITLQILTQ